MPVFLPFAGCPSRCLYCAQNLQTAMGMPDIRGVLAEAEAMLVRREREGRPPAEAAFYGGTFTAQREAPFELCLAAAGKWMSQGLIHLWRCSTRPDSLDASRLERMRAAGCTCIELGVQSFEDSVLEASLRGYGGEAAARAVGRVRDGGFLCGVQLLPGLPGSTASGFVRDVKLAVELGAGLLRFYPCLVVRSTGLARLYEAGLYRPWDVPATIEALARGLAVASLAMVPVTRIGVAYEPEFEPHVLAGPRDPDLGTRVRSRALILAVKRHLPPGAKIARAVFPRQAGGYLYGHRREAAPALAALGLDAGTVCWHDSPQVLLETE
ncbi:MAG: radical SAM protein [Desulfovibrionaceae bacterium]|nr:radical SAM protein [Desulfovibrionaceae bacterium]